MNSPFFQLLVLAGIAVFLILKLRSVLGTREGFEKPPVPLNDDVAMQRRQNFEVIENTADHDIIDHVPEGSDSAAALTDIKKSYPDFSVSEFLQGARGAYEMILMAFENGDLTEVKDFIDPEIFKALTEVIKTRDAKGLKIEATFIGISEMAVQDVLYFKKTDDVDISLRFTGEFSYTVKDVSGKIVEGGPQNVKRQKDVWTFSRKMSDESPNWYLVSTGA